MRRRHTQTVMPRHGPAGCCSVLAEAERRAVLLAGACPASARNDLTTFPRTEYLTSTSHASSMSHVATPVHVVPSNGDPSAGPALTEILKPDMSGWRVYKPRLTPHETNYHIIEHTELTTLTSPQYSPHAANCPNLLFHSRDSYLT
jgi:hypothetical protein